MIELTLAEFIFIVIAQAVVAYILFFILKKTVFQKTEHVSLNGPVVMWRSKTGLNTLDDLAKKFPRFWKIYADLGIVLAFGFAGAMYVLRKKPLGERIGLSFVGSALLLLVSPASSLLYDLARNFFSFITVFSSFIIQLIFSDPQAFAYFSTETTRILSSTMLSVNTLLTTVPSPGIPVELAPFFSLALFFFGFSGWLSLILAGTAGVTIKNFLFGQPVTAGAAPAIPGVRIKGSPFMIPWYGWFALPIFIIVHEASHGILSRVANVKVKNAGLMFFGFFPLGAFVEPDEDELKKVSAIKQLRVFAAGSMANYSTAVLLTVALTLIISPALQASGFDISQYDKHPVIYNLDNSSDACQKMSEQLEGGIALQAVNGTQVKSVEDAVNVINETAVQGNVLLQTNKGNFTVQPKECTEDPKRCLVGIVSIGQEREDMPPEVSLIVLLLSFTGIVILFSFLIGVMNLLPIFILDGGLMFEKVLEEKFNKKTAKFIFFLVGGLLLLFLLINLAPLFFPSTIESSLCLS